MTKQTIGKELAAQARKANLCKPWLAEMTKAEGIQPLCKMFFDGSDWAMKKDFPSLEILRKFRGNSDNYGLHTDFKGTLYLSEERNQKAFFGESNVALITAGFAISEIYVRHNSRVLIEASGNAFVVVNLLDDAFAQIVCTDDAKVNIHQYGNTSNFNITGNVIIHEGKFNSK